MIKLIAFVVGMTVGFGGMNLMFWVAGRMKAPRK